MKKILLKRGSKEYGELEIKLVKQGYIIAHHTRDAQVWTDKNYSNDSKIVIEFYGL